MSTFFKKALRVFEKRVDSHPDMIEKPSGLRYVDLRPGHGAAAKCGQRVNVHYTGWLNKSGKRGVKFDSSHGRGTPFSFELGFGRVIPGWEEGIEGMMVGGRRLLLIPARLGYGSKSVGSIPSNSDLIFEVDLLSCKY